MKLSLIGPNYINLEKILYIRKGRLVVQEKDYLAIIVFENGMEYDTNVLLNELLEVLKKNKITVSNPDLKKIVS